MTCRKCTAALPQDAIYCHICGAKQAATKTARSRPNGSGTVYKRGKTYTAQKRIKASGGKFKSITKGGFKRKVDAINYLPHLGMKESPESRTLNHYWTLYSENKMLKLSGSKQTAYRIAWNRLKDLWPVPISQIGIKQLQELINTKAQTYYPARDVKNLLSHLYKPAIGDDEVKTNLSELIDLPAKDEKETQPFTDEEVAALWEAFGAGYTFIGYILLMTHSGMMPGELFKCLKENIDLAKQQIRDAGIKTKTRRETPIMIADYLIPVIKALMIYSPGKKLLTMNKDKFYIEYYKALERAGCRKLSPYSCRHTTGTKLDLDGNTSPSVIAKVLRQKSVVMQERYKHPDVSDALEAVNSLSTAYIPPT